MKKLSFFWILALVICSVISCAEKEQFEQELQTQKREQFKEKLSHEVTQTEARVKLEKMLPNLKLPSTRGGDTNSLPPITSVYTTGKAAVATRAGEEIEPYFHIFNFGNEEGFAIMSGDDRVEPLLALTFKGELTPETEIENPGFEFAYEKMEDYYLRIIRDTIPSIQPDLPIPPRDTLPLPEFPVRYEEKDTLIYQNMNYGYCPVKWTQESPYNKFCFVPGTNNKAGAGCVAVAMAQLMAIYKYPNSYNGYTFNWMYMIYPYMSIDGYDQISRLIQLLGLGQNLNMQYRAYPNSSDADILNIPTTFINFGYSSGGSIVDYNTTDVVNELKSGYPILVGGVDGDSSHMWLGHGVLDCITTYNGYNELDELIMTSTRISNYILYNWGWGGLCDGYYLSSIFDTKAGPKYPDPTRSIDDGNYKYAVEVVMNIRKN